MEKHENERVAARLDDKLRDLRAARNYWFCMLMMRLMQRQGRAVVRALSDRQLRDAGIELSAAGRGRQVAARRDPNVDGAR